MAILVDTNLLVYRLDARFPKKREVATAVLHEGLETGRIRIPHQAIVEFVSVATRARRDQPPLLSGDEARSEAENLMNLYQILYPNDTVLRTAFRGAAVYQLPWFDAHIWAYAECFGLTEIYSEDFQHGRLYGRVRATNPFL